MFVNTSVQSYSLLGSEIKVSAVVQDQNPVGIRDCRTATGYCERKRLGDGMDYGGQN